MQTAAFYKEDGNGETAWHSDLNTAPFDSNDMITFWLALTDVPGTLCPYRLSSDIISFH